MKHSYLAVMLSFLKLGAISFGGGSALIPIIEDELVGKKKWIEKEPFDFSVVVASIAPASLSIALCAVWSRRYSVISSYAYALPGPLMFLILLTGFSLIGETGVRYIGFASVGILSFILMILFSFIKKNYAQSVKNGIRGRYLLIMITAFFLTSGSIVRRLLYNIFGFAQLPEAVFAISMLNLIFMAFFVILFVGSSSSKVKLGLALFWAGFYALASGRIDLFSGWVASVTVTMVALAAISVTYDAIVNRDTNKPLRLDKKPLRNLLFFLLISGSLTLLIFVITGDTRVWEFSARVMLSSLTSYGGGEVYIGVADAVFVQTGFLSSEAFHGRVVGFSSAVPGSVLLATVAGIGFMYGSSLGGVAYGWIFGILGVALGVAATALGALILFIGFDMFEGSHRLHMVIKYMMAIVCGVLISTALTLLNQAASVLIREGVHPWLSAGAVILMFFLMMIMRKKYQVNDIKLLLMGGFGTLAVMAIFL